MQLEIPLTPALSPSDGARVKPICAAAHSPDGVRFGKRTKRFPLPIRWGEGQGEGLLQLHRYGSDDHFCPGSFISEGFIWRRITQLSLTQTSLNLLPSFESYFDLFLASTVRSGLTQGADRPEAAPP